MDARRCPDCGGTVHGNNGQREHQAFHEAFIGMVTGLTELLDQLQAHLPAQGRRVNVSPPPWTAVTDGTGLDVTYGDEAGYG